MKILFLSMLIVVLLSACNLEFLNQLKKLNDKYCTELDENVREEIIRTIREKDPDYPDGGECEVKEKIEKRIIDWLA